MKRLLLIPFILIATWSDVRGQAVPAKVDPDAKAKEEVISLDRERNEAVLKGDTVALARILADDYTLVREDGAMFKKAERIAELRAGKIKFESILVDHVQVRIYGDVAVLTALDLMRKEGQASVAQIRSIRIYVRRDGRWELVTSQQTRTK